MDHTEFYLLGRRQYVTELNKNKLCVAMREQWEPYGVDTGHAFNVCRRIGSLYAEKRFADRLTR